LRLRSSARRERMRRFALDDDSLGNRKAVLIAAQCVGVDEEGKVSSRWADITRDLVVPGKADCSAMPWYHSA
jgi:hypothetical protein